MARKDLSEAVARETGQPVLKIYEILTSILNQMALILAEEGIINIRQFGVFRVKVRKSRVVRNPFNGELVNVPDKKYISFKASKPLKEKVQ